MSCRADEFHDATLDVGQQHILLRFAEAVNLINEKDRGLAGVLKTVVRRGQDTSHVGHVRFHAAEAFESATGVPGDDLGQRRLPGSRGSEEDHRLHPVGFDRATEQLAGPQDVLLADVLAEGLRAESGGEGRG